MLFVTLMKKLLERFTKKNLQETNQKEFKVEQGIKTKCHKIHVKWKDYDMMILLIVELIKKDIIV